MLAQRWPYVVKPTQEKVSLSYLYVAHDDVDPALVLRCASNANYQPTVQRFVVSEKHRGLARFGSELYDTIYGIIQFGPKAGKLSPCAGKL